MGVAEFGEACADRFGYLPIMEEGSEFSFRSRCHHVPECPTFGMDDAIGSGIGWGDVCWAVVAKGEVSPYPGPRIFYREVGCATFNV